MVIVEVSLPGVVLLTASGIAAGTPVGLSTGSVVGKSVRAPEVNEPTWMLRSKVTSTLPAVRSLTWPLPAAWLFGVPRTTVGPGTISGSVPWSYGPGTNWVAAEGAVVPVGIGAAY